MKETRRGKDRNTFPQEMCLGSIEERKYWNEIVCVTNFANELLQQQFSTVGGLLPALLAYFPH